MTAREIVITAMKQTNEILPNLHWSNFDDDAGIMDHVTGRVMQSMDFVAFLMLVEDMIYEQTGKHVQLMSDKTFSRSVSPFRTVATLAEYVGAYL